MNLFRLPLFRSGSAAAAFAAVVLAFPAVSSAKAVSAPAATRVIESCNWNRPGLDPYQGDVASAVDRYPDLAPDVRARLRERMAKLDYDDVVTIERDHIVGKARYGSTIRDMHFGANKVCRTVSRSGWRDGMQEAGLVYCDSGECILVPTVCRNVSRITRAEVSPDSAFGDEPPLAALPPTAGEPSTPLAKVAPIALLDSPPTFEGRGNPPEVVYPGGIVVWPGGPPSGGGGGLLPPGGGGGQPPQPPRPPVTPIPEPETWAMMLAGLAGIAALRRRRKVPAGAI